VSRGLLRSTAAPSTWQSEAVLTNPVAASALDGGSGRACCRPSRDGSLAFNDQPAVGLGQVLREGAVYRVWFQERLGVAARVAGQVEEGGGVRDVER